MTASADLRARPAPEAVRREIEQFLYFEARLLDEGDYSCWMTLLTDDIHYWMPTIENRTRSDPKKSFGPERLAYFDDSLADIRKRIARFQAQTAWAENPTTRHVHIVTNIEVEESNVAGEFVAHSAFTNYRNRGERDEDLLFGRRRDILRKVDGEWRLARRLILLAQTVLLSKNLNTFL